MRLITLFVSLVIYIPSLYPQSPKSYTSSEIYQEIKKLNFLGTALYIAAHPDDENTQMISYLSNELHARTAYLSLTRGDGGQNLIGTELRELLGLIRTQELLAARHIDGGEQLFSRANDFGFSKHPDETLNIWDKDSVLADVVLAIRKLRPDIIINRFDHRRPGTTHGHHTSSAILSVAAFDLAADVNSYPNQLKQLQPWQPKRLFYNTSWWAYGSQDEFEKATKKGFMSIDIGKYYTNLGKSNGEIAAQSRSQHRSQGFGSSASRGSTTEYLELLKGSQPDNNNLFAGINTTWSRIDGTEEIAKLLKNVEHNFDFKNPASHLPQLLKAYTLIQNLKDPYWKKLKTRQIKDIILACAGLYLEASAQSPQTTPGSETTIRVEAINRSRVDVRLEQLSIAQTATAEKTDIPLLYNRDEKLELSIHIPQQIAYSTPYWLVNKGSIGMYRADRQYIGLPESPASLTACFQVLIEGVSLEFCKDVVYKHTDPAQGERYQPFLILPPVTASTENEVYIFENSPKPITVKLKAIDRGIEGDVALDLPKGWTVSPNRIPIKLEQTGDEKSVVFNISPPDKESVGVIKPSVYIGGKKYDKKLVEIDYEHIPHQSVLLPAEARVVNFELKKSGNTVAYIPGAGDKVPESLRQLGYKVNTIDISSITTTSLSAYDAVVIGIRAYNVFPSLYTKQSALLEYVKSGGNLIVQYNTVGRNSTTDVKPPYPLHLSNDRVTDENSKVTLLEPEHPILNTPNKIVPSDFEGWVQERGLYFPDQWAKEYSAILSMHDTGENPKDGSLLVAPYGKGYYIYTGLSFFRELPAGVPGAFKLFANMLSIGKQKTENP
ncbi:PIG-L family deacetylase [Sinomicrobium sp.]